MVLAALMKNSINLSDAILLLSFFRYLKVTCDANPMASSIILGFLFLGGLELLIGLIVLNAGLYQAYNKSFLHHVGHGIWVGCSIAVCAILCMITTNRRKWAGFLHISLAILNCFLLIPALITLSAVEYKHDSGRLGACNRSCDYLEWILEQRQQQSRIGRNGYGGFRNRFKRQTSSNTEYSQNDTNNEAGVNSNSTNTTDSMYDSPIDSAQWNGNDSYVIDNNMTMNDYNSNAARVSSDDSYSLVDFILNSDEKKKYVCAAECPIPFKVVHVEIAQMILGVISFLLFVFSAIYVGVVMIKSIATEANMVRPVQPQMPQSWYMESGYKMPLSEMAFTPQPMNGPDFRSPMNPMSQGGQQVMPYTVVMM